MELLKDLVQPLGVHNPVSSCVRTSSVSHLVKYDFSHLNPMQTMACEYVDKDNNLVVVSPTASGKTVVIELFIGQAIAEGKKALCLFPLKALTEEKLNDWLEDKHTFSKYNIVPITGDYKMNEKKKEELDNANIILATSEMLDSKTRNYNSNQWLNEIGTLIVDEAHLLGSSSRGPKLESAIMRFCRYKPDCKIVLLSATVPNKNDLVDWLNILTTRKTALVESDYRPCLLHTHFVKFRDDIISNKKSYDAIEKIRMDVCYKVLNMNPQDQHIIFTGNKYWGYSFKNYLKQFGIDVEFHNSDLSKKNRLEIERKFKSGELKYIVSTSTLAAGLNLPARRVILAHTSYGMTAMEVYEVDQTCGRAGRPKYDPEGDAYIVLPVSSFNDEVDRIKNGFEVKSSIHKICNLAFNVVSEITLGNIKNIEDFHKWYELSLSYIQNVRLNSSDYQMVFDLLEQKKMILKDGDEYIPTHLGKIASVMYMNPLDVYDWFINFLNVSKINPDFGGDPRDATFINKQVSLALANCYEYNKNRPYISKSELNSDNVEKLVKLTNRKPDGVLKIASCYFAMLNGDEISPALKGAVDGLKLDIERIVSTVKLIHKRYANKITKHSSAEEIKGYRYSEEEWDSLFLRIKYGVPTELCNLVKIPGVGEVFARKLYSKNIKNVADFITKSDEVKTILGQTRYSTIMEKIKNGMEEEE